jgi:hypothetical protein
MFIYNLDRKKLRQVRRREGRYLLRSNLTDGDPVTLWNCRAFFAWRRGARAFRRGHPSWGPRR